MPETHEKNPLTNMLEVEVGSESRHLFHKLTDYWQIIVVALSAILLLAASYGGYRAYHDRKLTRAENELSQAVLENRNAQLVAVLDSMQTSMPKALLPRYWLESAKAAQDLEDWARALDFWKKLADNGSDNWRLLGALGHSATLLHLDKPQEALAELEILRGQTPESLMPTVLQRLGEAAEMTGDWERALSAYEELKVRQGGSQPGFLDFKMNEVRERMIDERS